MEQLIHQALTSPNVRPEIGPRLEGLSISDLVARIEYEFTKSFVGPIR